MTKLGNGNTDIKTRILDFRGDKFSHCLNVVYSIFGTVCFRCTRRNFHFLKGTSSVMGARQSKYTVEMCAFVIEQTLAL